MGARGLSDLRFLLGSVLAFIFPIVSLVGIEPAAQRQPSPSAPASQPELSAITISDRGSTRTVTVRAGHVRPVAGIDWWSNPGLVVIVGKGGARLNGRSHVEGATFRVGSARELVASTEAIVIPSNGQKPARLTRTDRNYLWNKADGNDYRGEKVNIGAGGELEIVNALAEVKGTQQIVYPVAKGEELFRLKPRFNTSARVEAKIGDDGDTIVTIKDGSVARWEKQWMPFAGSLNEGSHVEVVLKSDATPQGRGGQGRGGRVGVVNGKVVGKKSGIGLSESYVVLCKPVMPALSPPTCKVNKALIARTEPDGAFTLKGVPAGSYAIVLGLGGEATDDPELWDGAEIRIASPAPVSVPGAGTFTPVGDSAVVLPPTLHRLRLEFRSGTLRTVTVPSREAGELTLDVYGK